MFILLLALEDQHKCDICSAISNKGPASLVVPPIVLMLNWFCAGLLYGFFSGSPAFLKSWCHRLLLLVLIRAALLVMLDQGVGFKGCSPQALTSWVPRGKQLAYMYIVNVCPF